MLVEILDELRLLNWSTLHYGLEKGLATRSDVISHAVAELDQNDSNERILLLAGGENLSDEELKSLLENLSDTENKTDVSDRWRMAILLSIARSTSGDQEKIDWLQEALAEFGYPEDMRSCSIYSDSTQDPLVALDCVIEQLCIELGIAGSGKLCKRSHRSS